MFQVITKLLAEKTGLNKGDATSIGTSSGLAIIFMLMYFVSQREYDQERKTNQDQLGILWRQVHTIQNYLAVNGIFVPDVSGEAPNTNTNLLKK